MGRIPRALMGLTVAFLLVPVLSYALTGQFDSWLPSSSTEGHSLAESDTKAREASEVFDGPLALEDTTPADSEPSTVPGGEPVPTATSEQPTEETGEEHNDHADDGGSNEGTTAAKSTPSTSDGSQGTPSSGAGATITGDACPCTVKGTSELKATVNLKGDLVVDGGVLLARPGVTVNGNGFQIIVMNGGSADFQGTSTSTWSGNGSNANLSRDITFNNLRRIMFHAGAARSTLRFFTIADSGTAGVLGDYPLHFHLNGNSVRGTLVEGVVVVNGKNHAFVPHGSHGITFRDTIAKNIVGDAYWWDPPGANGGQTVDNSNDILYDHVLADGVRPSSSQQSHRNSAFTLGAGSGNVIRNSVARNVQGESDCSGFHWPEQANMNPGGTVWTFRNNAAYNNECHGIFVWQNDDNSHVVENFSGSGIEHGAYKNHYHYVNPKVPYFEIHALSWKGVTGGSIGRVEIRGHALPGSGPIKFSGTSIGSVVVRDASDDNPGIFHFDGTGLTCGDVKFPDAHPETIVVVDGTECGGG